MFGRPAGVLERDDPKRGQAGGRAGGASTDDAADATTNYVSPLNPSPPLPLAPLCRPFVSGERDDGLLAHGRAPDGAEWECLESLVGLVNLRRCLRPAR
jgi:hypothetical protein